MLLTVPKARDPQRGIRHREIGRIREVEALAQLQAPGFAQGNVLKHRHIQNARVGAGAWCCAPRC